MHENKFGYEPMLEIDTDFHPSDNQLNKLAQSMVEPKRIPAGYTYLGQFIDHDISLDSANRILPWQPLPQCIFNKRSPFLNLETIYGSGNPDEPPRSRLLKAGSNTLLKLGDTMSTSIVNKVFPDKDLQRIPGSSEALIVEPRNDENLIVAQTQVAFTRFHNAVVKHLKLPDTVATFEAARKIVIQHYQWIILKDYLPRIIKKSVLNDVLNEGNRFYFPNPETPFVPLEFSFAAFRTGHSMIRDWYNWNIIFNDDPRSTPPTLMELTAFTGRCGLRKLSTVPANYKLPSQWIINWRWFYEFPDNSQRQKLNFASEINTKLAPLLGLLPAPGTGCNFALPSVIFRRETSLAAFDLYRTRALNLPSGQAVAKAILGTEDLILKPGQIANLLPANLKHAFSKETPLWFYLLAEAEIEERGQNLGEVGSRIIAETFVKLIELSEFSILRGDFEPEPKFHPKGKEFGMVEMLEFVAATEGNQEGFDPLNPLENEDVCDEQVRKAIEDFIFNRIN